MDHIFLDTDVILDLLAGKKPFSDLIAGILDLAEKSEIMVYTSPLTYSNVSYILGKTVSPRRIKQLFLKLESIIRTAEMPSDIVRKALHSEFYDFEDALQNYTAESHPEITILITRNTKDYKHSRLSVMTAETYLRKNKNDQG